MLSSTLLTILSACALAAGQTTGKLGDAPEVTSNPAAAYQAELEAGKISGWAKASSEAGKAVAFTITVDGLPEDAGPFSMLRRNWMSRSISGRRTNKGIID